MKKTTSYSLLSLLLLLVGYSNAWADETWVKTDPSQLQTGDVVVIVETVNSLALPSSNGSSSAPAGVSVDLSGDQLEEAPAETLQWVVTVSNGSYQFNVPDTENYLYCTNANNGVRVGGNSNNAFTIKDDYLYNTATSRYVGVYLTNPDWRCYTTINNNIKDQAFGFFKKTDGGGGTTITVAKPVITPAGGTYDAGEVVEVTITAEEGNTIIYTTDGVEPGATAGIQYTEPFTISESSTVKAVAFDAEGNASSVAKADFTFVSPISTIAELCAAPAGTVTVQFVGWTVTGVKGTSNAYFTDGKNGILLYQNNHGFEVGDQLRGKATFNLTSYNGAPEITGLTATTEGVSVVAKGVEVTPLEVNIADLDNTHQGNLIVLKGVTYDGKNFVDSDDNSIMPYNTFITLPTLTKDEVYDATGVFVWYKGTKEIAPRSADDIVLAITSSVAKPVITPEGGTYTEAQSVTITAEEGLVISYTTDGTDPYESQTAVLTDGNTVTFEVAENTTVRAVAIDATGAPSDEVTAEYNIVSDAQAIPSIARLNALATSDEQSVLVRFNDWYVTGVNGNQYYLTDGTDGVVAFQREHGFKVGDKITGTGVVNIVLYNDLPEVTGLTTQTSGVEVEEGGAAKPQSIVIADIDQNKQGCLVTYESLTYSDGKFVDDDDNTITPYNTFKLSDYPTLLEGKAYSVTGVIVYFRGIWEIAPRTADEFVLLSSQIEPEEAFWSVEDEVVVDLAEGTLDAHFYTSSDGAVTYSSSDEGVATIDEEGVIALVGAGITTITANVAETETYLPASVSFTLTVTKEGYADATFAFSDEDIKGQGTSGGGSGFSATRNDVLTLTITNGYGAAQHIKVYADGQNKGEDSYLTLQVADGYAIAGVMLEIANANNPGEWEDQFGYAPVVEEASVTWEGMQNKVALHQKANKQAQIKTISVTYIKLQDTGKTVTIGETGLATFCSDVKCVLSGEEQFAIAGAITGANEAVLVVDTLTSSIPSSTGVLLMGAPGEYKVYTHPDLIENRPNLNLLTGVLEDTAAPVGSYVLQEQETVGFFQVVEEAPITVPAGHAYLTVPGSNVKALFFTEEDYVTGINNVAELGTSDAIYNLAGQRLQKMQKGINIVGGKKILK